MSTKSDIAAELVTRIEAIASPVIKYVAFEEVRLHVDDFLDHELPAVQFYDGGTQANHVIGRLEKSWLIHCEIIMKSTSAGLVQQKDLWDLEFIVERKIWERPKLAVDRFKELKYLGAVTDLHIMEPMFLTRIDFLAEFFDPLISDC